jgi:hypothetical protein
MQKKKKKKKSLARLNFASPRSIHSVAGRLLAHGVKPRDATRRIAGRLCALGLPRPTAKQRARRAVQNASRN